MVYHFDRIGYPPGYPLFTLMCNRMTLSSSVFFGKLLSTIFAQSTLIVSYFLVGVLLNDNKTAFVATLSHAFSATF
jgi:hypothetical protein